MWALRDLGLEPGADERDVKRAYARRLRSVRPDEDPKGFQRLHETYAAALAHARRRAEAPDDEPEPPLFENPVPDPVEAGNEPAEAIAEAYRPDEPSDECRPSRDADAPAPASLPWQAEAAEDRTEAHPEARANDLTASADSASEAEPEPAPRHPDKPADSAEPFRFDLDSFLGELISRAREPDAPAFRAWLDGVSSRWPLATKSAIVRHVFNRVLAAEAGMTGANLETIIGTFGFDDVLAVPDPIALTQLRERLAHQDRLAMFGRLLRKDNRRELCAYMDTTLRGGYSPAATRLMAFILTNPLSVPMGYALRFVPWLRGVVVRFLLNLDEGRSIALNPGIGSRTLAVWQSTYERLGTVRLWLQTALVLALIGAQLPSLFTTPAPSRRGWVWELPPLSTTAPERTRETDAYAEAMRGEELRRQGKFAEALPVYEAIIAKFPAPWTPRVEWVNALAYFHRANMFAQEGWKSQATDAYEELYRHLSDSKHRDVRNYVAMGLVNKALLFYNAKQYQSAYDDCERVVEDFDGTGDRLFDLQVAKALGVQAESLVAMGRRDEALRVGNETIRKFSRSSDRDIQDSVTITRDLMREIQFGGRSE